MKIKLILLIINALLFSELSFSQSMQEKIQAIRKEYYKIEDGIKNNSFTVKEIEYECDDSNEYGHFTLNYSNDTLVYMRISSVMYEEHGETIHYYFKDKKLFFVFHESQTTEWVDENEQIYHFSETRSYYHNEQAFECLSRGYEVIEKKGENIKTPYVANTAINCSDVKDLDEKLVIALEFLSKEEKGKVCFWLK